MMFTLFCQSNWQRWIKYPNFAWVRTKKSRNEFQDFFLRTQVQLWFFASGGSLLSWHKREEKVKSSRCFSPHQKKPSPHFWLGLRFRFAIFFDPPFSTHPAIIGTASGPRVERALAAWTGPRTRSRFIPGCQAISHNGLQLPEGGDFEAFHCQPSSNFDRSTKLDLTTEPPLLGRCCWLLLFC